VAQALEQRHLVDQHGVAEVQVGRRRVESALDAQRPPPVFSFFSRSELEQDFGCAAAQFRKLFQGWQHRFGSLVAGRAGRL